MPAKSILTIPQCFSDFSRIVFFDTETTGLDHKRDHITELSALCLHHDGTCRTMDDYINLPDEVEIHPEAIKKTGITRELLREKGIPEKEAAQHFANLYAGNGKTLFVAHNAQFDLLMLQSMLGRCETCMPQTLCIIDTMTVFKDRKDYPHKLEDAIIYYGLEGVENSHNAFADVQALHSVFFAMNKEKADLDKYVNLFGVHKKYGITGGVKIEGIRYRIHPYGQWKSRKLYDIDGE